MNDKSALYFRAKRQWMLHFSEPTEDGDCDNRKWYNYVYNFRPNMNENVEYRLGQLCPVYLLDIRIQHFHGGTVYWPPFGVLMQTLKFQANYVWSRYDK